MCNFVFLLCSCCDYEDIIISASFNTYHLAKERQLSQKYYYDSKGLEMSNTAVLVIPTGPAYSEHEADLAPPGFDPVVAPLGCHGLYRPQRLGEV